MPGEDVLLPLRADDRRQAVDAVPKVDGLTRQQNTDGPGQEMQVSPECREELGEIASVRAGEKPKCHAAG